MKPLHTALAVALFGTCTAVPTVHAQPTYRLESAVALPSAAPDWDYVTLDAAHDRLFIGRRAEGAVVYDIKSQRVLRTLDKSESASGVILVPEFDRGYTANEDGTTTVFEISTLKTLDRAKFGEDSDYGFYDPVTKQIAFTMGDSHAIAFVDARDGRVSGKLNIDSRKLDGSAPDGAGHLFMALRDRNALLKIDMATRTVAARWPTTGCEQPTGVAYDSANQRIFVGCRGAKPVLAVLDSAGGKVVTTMEIGRGTDGVVYDAAARRIYTSNGVDANLVIYEQIDADHYKLDQAVTTRPYARTMAYDTASRKIYMITAEGLADPAKKINKAVAPFYPNRYYADSFTVLTYAPR
ncbi:MAG: hypothetical protein KGN16_22730 [Burkholderiales bacterium]|nr:hypothetical protein [Burkholderiales bacterium]